MPTPDLSLLRQRQIAWSRRTFLGKSAQAIGTLALGSLLAPRLIGAGPSAPPPADGRWRGVLGAPHFLPRAKRIIQLSMAGGPSHMETFDPKPRLNALHGQPFPESFTRGSSWRNCSMSAGDCARGAPRWGSPAAGFPAR